MRLRDFALPRLPLWILSVRMVLATGQADVGERAPSGRRAGANRDAMSAGVAPAFVVRAPNWLGDTVMAQPALAGLRAAAPDATITVVGRWASVLRGQGVADAFLEYPDGGQTGPFRPRAGRRAARPRPHPAELVRGRALGSPLARAAPGGLRYRCARCAAHRPGAAARPAPPSGRRVPPARGGARHARTRGGAAAARALRARARGRGGGAARRGRVRGAPRVGLHLGAAGGPAEALGGGGLGGAGGSSRTRVGWPRCCSAARGTSPPPTPSSGSPVPRRRRWSAGTGRRCCRISSTRLRCLVSADTGVAHLAAALGIATVTLFGPTDPRLSAPRSSRAQVVAPGAPCAPCFLAECPIEHPCMRAITAEVVAARVRAAVA